MFDSNFVATAFQHRMLLFAHNHAEITLQSSQSSYLDASSNETVIAR